MIILSHVDYDLTKSSGGQFPRKSEMLRCTITVVYRASRPNESRNLRATFQLVNTPLEQPRATSDNDIISRKDPAAARELFLSGVISGASIQIARDLISPTPASCLVVYGRNFAANRDVDRANKSMSRVDLSPGLLTASH